MRDGLLERLADTLVETNVMAALGDTITFTPVGSAPLTFRAWGNFSEVARDLGGPQAIQQAMTVEVRRAQVPIRPSDGCRITIHILPGKTFKPVDVDLDAGGINWVFGLKEVR